MIVADPRFGILIAQKAGASFNPMTDFALARVENGVLYGGTTFSDYTGEGGSIMVHIAGFLPRWVNRHILHETANYTYNHCKCKIMLGQVKETQPKVLAFDLKLGFKEAAFLEGVFPDGGCHVLSMTRAECRWLLPTKQERVHG